MAAQVALGDSGVDPRAQSPVAPLRDDLHLVEVERERSGEPAWSIEDPVTNRFYRIGWLEFECLLRWGQTPERICTQVAAQTALEPDVEQVLELVEFLDRHQLLRPDRERIGQYAAEAAKTTPWLNVWWWLHHYLFFRIPLLRPQHALQKLADTIPWLFTRGCVLVVLLLSLCGVLLVLQRWDLFTHSVVELFSFSGLVSFACALVIAKSLHELGHALVATRQGVRVAHMGVAFIVLWPMLYTDTGESWKLKGAHQRLAISSAGILTELAIAGLATLGWVLTEPGALNSGLLYLATTSWMLSLALNASPFMRFDGYFILTDLLDFPNLHERAGAQARTWLRRRLLGLDQPWPEPFLPRQRLALVGFAFATWLYRLVLFLGIALVVYALFFKVLGIVLFIVEIAWFIVMPITRELSHWWSHRSEVPRRHRRVWWWLLLILVGVLSIPWQTSVSGPGVLRSQHAITVYAPFPALLEARRADGDVDSGSTVVTLSNPDVGLDLQAQQAQLANLDAVLAGLLANPQGLQQDSAARAQRLLNLSNIEATQREITRMSLNSPFAGRWQQVNPELEAGQWVSPRDPLGVLIDPEHWMVDAYVNQDEVHRLTRGSRVSFFVEGRMAPLEGELVDIAPTRTQYLEYPVLAEQHGGSLTIQQDAGRDTGRLHLERPLFMVRARLDAPWPEAREARGSLHIDAERESLVMQFVNWVAAIAIRESGF
ncbi:HlyD family efflux transporter periplasmic adaptor subunit [Halomonas binhaiensis]|uniref:HlyD family efflux transporter periplasmic adaptor subunit n=1 Tax=Halomonas binhaiensis TaxID=2562282 RepID=A0A5C1NB13_9GAMM|nr:HlyD family efflux transporter periplasmic adaptor subunit [Halomonas binhaiensis]QEM80334.1 HlyD family efflux transporter periplasmic adaptor subunit [Halomonas binhaiensis]